MNQPPVIRKIVRRDGNDIESEQSNRLEFRRSNDASEFPERRTWTKNTSHICCRLLRRSSDQDGDARGIEFLLSGVECQVAGMATTNSMGNLIIAQG